MNGLPPPVSGPGGAALVEQVRARLAAEGRPPTAEALAAAVADRAGLRGDAEVLAAIGWLRDELTGAGPLEPLLADPAVTDVLVNGAREVWVDRGTGLTRLPGAFGDDSGVRRLAQRLAAQGGRRLDEAAPFVDVRLPGGARLHAVLPPVCPDGPCLSLRLPRRRPFRLAELVAAGSLDRVGAELLRLLVASRLAFLVTGGAGAGKTTLLAALLGLVDPVERVVLVEDTGELRPELPHVVRLESRPPTAEGTGEVALRELVRQALRMRPDRIVLGEARGAEVVDLSTGSGCNHDSHRAQAVGTLGGTLRRCTGRSEDGTVQDLL